MASRRLIDPTDHCARCTKLRVSTHDRACSHNILLLGSAHRIRSRDSSREAGATKRHECLTLYELPTAALNIQFGALSLMVKLVNDLFVEDSILQRYGCCSRDLNGPRVPFGSTPRPVVDRDGQGQPITVDGVKPGSGEGSRNQLYL